MELDCRIAELRRSRVIDLVVATAWVIPAYLVIYLVLSMLFHAPAPYLALAGLVLVVLYGLMTLYQDAYHTWQSYELPLETWQGTPYATDCALTESLGHGHLLQELFLGVAVHVFGFMKKTHLITALHTLDRPQVSRLLDALRSKGTSPRFFPAYEFDTCHQVLVPLISAEMIWVKHQDDTMLIGLNRKYDENGAWKRH